MKMVKLKMLTRATNELKGILRTSDGIKLFHQVDYCQMQNQACQLFWAGYVLQKKMYGRTENHAFPWSQKTNLLLKDYSLHCLPSN